VTYFGYNVEIPTIPN